MKIGKQLMWSNEIAAAGIDKEVVVPDANLWQLLSSKGCCSEFRRNTITVYVCIGNKDILRVKEWLSEKHESTFFYDRVTIFVFALEIMK